MDTYSVVCSLLSLLSFLLLLLILLFLRSSLFLLCTKYSTTAETTGRDGTGATRVQSNTGHDEGGGDGWTHILLFLLYFFYSPLLLFFSLFFFCDHPFCVMYKA